MKASEIKTLSQLAEYINKEDGWFLETVNIIANNGWKDETDKKTGKYIRRERYAGNLSRSFYVGDGVKQEDFKASFKNGILRITVPKEDKKAKEEKNYITIGE